MENSWLREIWRRLRFLVAGARFEDDLAEEMRLCVESQVDRFGESSRGTSDAPMPALFPSECGAIATASLDLIATGIALRFP